MQKEFKVYCLFRTDNNQPIYYGITRQHALERLGQHFSSKYPGSDIRNFWDQGIIIDIKILYSDLSEREARKIEKELIQQDIHVLNKMSNYKHTPHSAKAVYKIDVDTLEVIERIDVISRVKDMYGYTPVRTSDCCNKKQAMAYGYYWCFEKDFQNFIPLDKKTMSRKIIFEKDYEGNIINTFYSLKEASEHYNVSVSTISHWINGKTKSKSNWEFVFCNEIQKNRTNSNRGKGRKYSTFYFTDIITKERLVVKNLNQFCKEKNLDTSSVYKAFKSNRVYKGYTISI